jgi:CheY-like chemotaxis protein
VDCGKPQGSFGTIHLWNAEMDASTPKLSVLVVDDYPDTTDSLARILRRDGHDVRVAYGGTQALGLLNGWQPDVAILDLAMPGMDGVQLSQRLCEQSPRRPLLVVVSGCLRKEDLDRGVVPGFDHHFLKPADPRELADLLRDHAAQRKSA